MKPSHILRGSILTLALTLPVVSAGQPTPPTAASAIEGPVTVPVVVAGAVQFDIRSKFTGRTYRIFVSKPRGTAPAEGFPALYTLDGNLTFGVAHAQAGLAAFEGRARMVVVGVGYAGGDPWTLRNPDMTPSIPTGATLASVSNGTKQPMAPGSYGDAELFHRFMTEELRPILIRDFAVAPDRQALMGYSLGGLYALHVLFRHPASFERYVIGSPSIWWNDREVLKDEAAFGRMLKAGTVAPRVLITSAEWEQSEAAPDLPPESAARATALTEMRESAMVDNARALAIRLAALKGGARYAVEYALFAQETHLSGIAAATGRGVTFAAAK